MSGASALLQALTMTEDMWEQAEREREEQMEASRLEREFVAKWLPVWRMWGRTQPGYEQYLIAK